MKKFGIDTSRWQGDFDFARARDEEGVEYAIIKCGGADDGLYTDREFENSYNKLSDADMHKGAYFYGNAFSEDEARNEARYCASILVGKSFCYPIFYDVEGAMLTGNDLTDIVMAFMGEMKEAGFTKVGLYSSESHINNYVDISRVKEAGYAIWVARYSDTEPNIGTDYDLWQFGGSDNFIRSNQINEQTVDQNYCYTNYCTDHVVEEITVPDYEPVPDTKYHKGDTVKVINAIQYDNGEPFNTYYDEYSVLSVSGRRVVIGIDRVITAAIDEDNISLVKCVYDSDINTDAISRGDSKKVKVLDNIDYDGNRFGVYYDEYDVIEEDGDRVVIGIGDVTTAAVNIANLEFIGGSGSDDTPTDIPFNGDIEEGSTVRFVGNTDYDGTPIKAWFDEYTVSEKSGDRVVLVHNGELFAAVNVTDCKLI